MWKVLPQTPAATALKLGVFVGALVVMGVAAFRGVLGAIEAAYGPPDLMCGTGPGPASGYQTAAERIWRRNGIVIRTIFRSTTIEAFEGCPDGDLTAGPCGLTAQLLVRISPPGEDAGSCPGAAPRDRA